MHPLGTLAEVVSGVTLGSEQRDPSGNETPYLRVANVQDGFLDLAEVKTICVTPDVVARLRLLKGDVLMNEGGDFDKLGRGTVWNDEIPVCIHQNHVFRVRPRLDRLLSDFLAYWSQSEFGKKYFVLSSKQSTNLASINATQLRQFPVASPTIDEQREITKRVNAVNSRLSADGRELAKLRQKKQGLMHDLLTGRVPVPLPAAEAVAAEA